MFEMHIWVTLRNTYENEDIVEEKEFSYDGIIQRLSLYDVELKKQNGNFFIEKTIFSNRRTKEVDEIIEVIRSIINVATGSYGMIYFWDDEDDNEKENEFQVYVIAKGKMLLNQDAFLSPCIPTIENE